jgi:hypothetical protein
LSEYLRSKMEYGTWCRSTLFIGLYSCTDVSSIAIVCLLEWNGEIKACSSNWVESLESRLSLPRVRNHHLHCCSCILDIR